MRKQSIVIRPCALDAGGAQRIKGYSGDNRLVPPERPQRRRCSAPRCRLTLSRGWRRSQGFGCSPIKKVRELGSDRRETKFQPPKSKSQTTSNFQIPNESVWSLYHWLLFVCLRQISRRERNWNLESGVLVFRQSEPR